MELTRRQGKVLKVLARLHERGPVGGARRIRIEEVAKESGVPEETCAHELRTMNGGPEPLVEWHFVMANPWYGVSWGFITPRGLAEITGKSLGAQARIVVLAALPQILAGAVTIVGGFAALLAAPTDFAMRLVFFGLATIGGFGIGWTVGRRSKD